MADGQPAPPSGQQVYDAIPHFGRLRNEVLFGDVWEQAELGKRDRSLVTCAVLATLGRDAELTHHVARAIDNGVTPDELRGMAVHLAFYSGWPAGIAMGRAAYPYLQGADETDLK